jgi:hypothetical protein
MEELKKYARISGVLIIAIGGFRVLLTGEYFGIPLFNYVNFSNLIIYTVDVLRGLLYNVAPVVFYLIFENAIIRCKFAKWIARVLEIRCITWLILISTVLFSIIYWFYLLPLKMGYCTNMGVKYLFEFLIILIGYLVTRFRLIDAGLATYALIVLFLYVYMKVNLRYEVYATSHPSHIIVTHKDSKLDTLSMMVTNTPDFFFFKDLANKTVIIPASDVHKVTVDTNFAKQEALRDCLPCWIARHMKN